MKLIILSLSLTLLFFSGKSQSYPQKLASVFDVGVTAMPDKGTFSFDTTFSNSGSSWEIDWSEEKVFTALFKYVDASESKQSYEMRIGSGGQIYSFKNNEFGEALPPQWRPSFDENGSNTSDPGLSDPIQSNHGNWAPWNDEVWQLVGSDQRDVLSNRVKTKNIHQAGSYMNNYAHRPSDLTEKPFYSPTVQSFFDETNQSYTTINWGQSENPAYVYDEFSDCDVCFEDAFKPSVLFYNRYKNLGDGVIQVDFLIYNYHRTRGIDYWNVPFVGIRNSSLSYAMISNSASNETTYDVLNSKPGHPDPTDEFSYLPEFSKGAVVKTSGNSSASSGWFAVSNTVNGAGPTLGFVTAKSTSNPTNGYGDIRYGTAMSNALRDVTIFTRRANGGAANSETGLKPWGIVGGEAIKGRYFIVVDANISSVVSQISNRDLTNSASIEIVSIDSLPENNINYKYVSTSNGYGVEVTNENDFDIVLNAQPFTASYPVYLIKTASEAMLSSNPFSLTLKPYDGTIKSIELLGFSSVPKENEIIAVVSGFEGGDVFNLKVYPNPASGILTIKSSDFIQNKNKIWIYNSTGQVVKAFSSVNAKMLQVNVSDLASGIYTLKHGTSFTKFVKK